MPGLGSEWMDQWLKTPFYANKCSEHPTQYKTIFCGVCMGKPYCGSCWEEDKSKNHQNHLPIIRVRRASGRTAIGIRELAQIWDVSGIQVYNINSVEIFHLLPNPNAKIGGQVPSCKYCTRKLNKSSPYWFCSIVCKYYYNNLNGGGMQRQGGEVDRAIEPNPTSLRKRRRKGTPARAASSSRC